MCCHALEILLCVVVAPGRGGGEDETAVLGNAAIYSEGVFVM